MTEPDDAYIAAVDARLQAAHRDGAETFDALLRQAQGADPVVVAQRAAAMCPPVCTVAPPSAELTPRPDSSSRPAWSPQLHPLRSEWYFTSQCAQRLAQRFGRGRLACLGAPTVAAAATHAVLFDIDAPTLRARFGTAVESIVSLDLGATTSLPLRDAPRFDAAVVDPPWYAPHPLHWLALAAAAVQPGGAIAIVVPPELQRPSAAAERSAVWRAAQAIGETTLEPQAVHYETPLFELIAMRAAGITVPSAWRTADLIHVQLEQSQAPPPHAPPPAAPTRFDTFRIQDQLVMLAHNDRGGAPGLTAVPRTNDYIWDRVSARDPRVPDIDLWTSSSRVATVHGRPAIQRALETLAAGERVHDGLVAEQLARVGLG